MPEMPHKDRENEVEERPSEKRQRLKSEKDPSRLNKSPRSARPKILDPITGEPVRQSHRRKKNKQPDSEPSASTADFVADPSRTSSAPESISRESLPYPSFSKAHSREAVNSREQIKLATAPPNTYTPEPTDLGSGAKSGRKSADNDSPKKEVESKDSRPPSPPETDFSQQRKATPTRATQVREETGSQSRPASQASERSWFGRQSRVSDERSRVSTKSKRSKASTAVKTSKDTSKSATVEDEEPNVSGAVDSASAIDSNATSVAPRRAPSAVSRTAKDINVGFRDSSPESAQDYSPPTPIATPQFPLPERKPTPSPFVSFDVPDSQDEAYDSPQPPPPPPPPSVPINVPRVDYLMQNGGLPITVPKTMLALNLTPVITPHSIKLSGQASTEVEKVFSPFYNLLEQYETVISKNGSIAVATGYRSVARRLLDRLENVFARDLSSEGCFCVMCQQKVDFDVESKRGLGWGEVLEWVSDRRDLPVWPAFDFAAIGINPDDIAALETSGQHRNDAGPIAIDPDVAEEFRDHFMQQSKKKKIAVSKWLSSFSPASSAPPPEIDDETLNFTILTHLESEQRPIFNALLAGSSKPLHSASRAPTPMAKPRSDLIVKTCQALQRLYRLPVSPRDPEACVYLLMNPGTHNLLATLSSINTSEWEILTSGRFDGFLWSGAESEFPGSMMNSPLVSRGQTPANGMPSRGPTPAGRHPSLSRITTPFSAASRNNTFSPPNLSFPSRGPTPSSFMFPPSIPPTPLHGRHPVSNDEETEIAALAEVEREIYAGMEALEDAFEALHRKAEIVRRALRERGAGLSMAAQSRRTSLPEGIFARMGTPGVGPVWETVYSEVDVESDWGGDEARSELAPDDSASNISSSRRRRPVRRTERRTPAPLEEEDEG